MFLKQSSPDTDSRRRGFTLIELLVGVAILALLVVLMLSLFSSVSTLWGEFQARKSREQTARMALEAISRDLRSAAFPVGTPIQKSFAFLISPPTIGTEYLCPDAGFWQSRNPLSPVGFVDAGYFIRWNGDRAELCQLRIPDADADSIFTNIDRTLSSATLERLAPGSANSDLHGLLAENVIGLWMKPLDSEQQALPIPFDSRTSLKKLRFVEVTVAVIDPTTSDRLGDASTIHSAYTSDPEDFLAALPDSLARGVRIFTERIPVYANP